MRTIKIDKDKIKNSLKYVLNEMQLIDNDNIIDYMRLPPVRTGLNFDIFIDDGGTYILNKHPIYVYYKDGDDYKTIILPLNNQNINYSNLYITDEEFQSLIHFLRINEDLLIKFANEEITHQELAVLLKPIINNKKIKKHNNMALNEMSKLHPRNSGLSTMLWLDEGNDIQHAPRIKFKASQNQINSNEYSSMTISDNPQIFNLPKDCNLKKRELEEIMKFVVYHKDLLLQLRNGEIDMITFVDKINFNYKN